MTDQSSATATNKMMAAATENISAVFITDHGSSLAIRSLALRAGRTAPLLVVFTRPVRSRTGPAAAFAACSALANSASITSGVIFGFTRVSSLALGAAGASGFGVTTVASVSRVLGMAVVT